MTDASIYLDAVKRQFQDQPEVYSEFLDIMKDFQHQKIDALGVIQRVSKLFHRSPFLMQGFSLFLPAGYRVEIGTNPAGDPHSIIMTTPTSTTTHSILEMSTQGNPKSKYSNKITARYWDDEYKDFLDLLHTDAPDALAEFANFMPDVMEGTVEDGPTTIESPQQTEAPTLVSPKKAFTIPSRLTSRANASKRKAFGKDGKLRKELSVNARVRLNFVFVPRSHANAAVKTQRTRTKPRRERESDFVASSRSRDPSSRSPLSSTVLSASSGGRDTGTEFESNDGTGEETQREKRENVGQAENTITKEESLRVQALFENVQKCRKVLRTQGDEAQRWLDLLQALLDNPGLPRQTRSSVFNVMLRLSKKSGMYPKCLTLKNIEKLGEYPVAGGGFGDVWKGKVANQIASDIASGLAHLHDLKIVHGDIKGIFAGCAPFHDLIDGAVLLAVYVEKQHPPRPPELDDDVWELMTSCWKYDPALRPTATGVLDRVRLLAISTNSAEAEGHVLESAPDWESFDVDRIRSNVDYPSVDLALLDTV
ncbi:Paired amphipathic helix protein Sin3a [Marasmius tenuissimus]|uniref:Paired amphipathic helix protein Sin3a n=1 Tax=Marasmius tenuissimus TaxID=585030 RepID=A0ABR2Z6W8_9AGAR